MQIVRMTNRIAVKVFVLCVISCVKVASSPAADVQEEIEIAWRSNKESLGAVEFDLELVSTQLTDKLLAKQKLAITKGFSFSTEPRIESRRKIVVDGEKLLASYFAIDGRVNRKRSFDGNVWIEEVSGQYVSRTPLQLGSVNLPAIDPREAFMPVDSLGFSSIFRAGKLEFDVSEDEHILVRTKYRGTLLEVTCKTNLAYMPVRSVWYNAKNLPFMEATVDYQFVESRNSYAPKKVVIDYYDFGSLDSTKQQILSVEKLTLLDRPITTTISIPPEAVFIDLANKTYPQPIQESRVPKFNARMFLVGSLVFAVSVVFLRYFLKANKNV
jgi:hypothetical protein